MFRQAKPNTTFIVRSANFFDYEGVLGFFHERRGVKEMLIEKILNNNVVITKDRYGNEIIIMGRGLAYCKKIGQKIEKDKIDKVYRLSSDELSQKFQELLLELPIEYLAIVDQIIDYSKEILDAELNDSIYISLTDHVFTSMERKKNGLQVRNALLWDIKRFYPKEFKIGMKMIEKIKEHYDIDLPEDEAGFIALHLVNAQTGNSEMNNMYDLTKIIQDIMNIITYYFKITIDEDSVYFYRFTTHLRFFISRMQSNKPYKNETDEDLLEIVRKKYWNAYQCVDKIAEFLAVNYHYETSTDERLYLTIHIARIVEKNG